MDLSPKIQACVGKVCMQRGKSIPKILVMLVITSSAAGFMVVILGMLAWGTWPAIQKWRSSVRFESFTIDLFTAEFLAILLFCTTLGMMSNQPSHVSGIDFSAETFFHQLLHSNTPGILYSIGGGFVNACTQFLLFGAIRLIGITTAFPIMVSIGAAGGTLLNYIIAPKGNVILVFLGVVLLTSAIILNAVVPTKRFKLWVGQVLYEPLTVGDDRDDIELRASDVDDELTDSTEKQLTIVNSRMYKLGVALSLVAGLLCAMWSPFASLSIERYHTNPFVVMFMFGCGELIGLVSLLLPIACRFDVTGDGTPFSCARHFQEISLADHFWTGVAGFLNSWGLFANFVAQSSVSLRCFRCCVLFCGCCCHVGYLRF